MLTLLVSWHLQDALSLDPTKFIQLQLKVANRLGDHARAIRLQIQLKGACVVGRVVCVVCRVSCAVEKDAI